MVLGWTEGEDLGFDGFGSRFLVDVVMGFRKELGRGG